MNGWSELMLAQIHCEELEQDAERRRRELAEMIHDDRKKPANQRFAEGVGHWLRRDHRPRHSKN